MIEDLVYEEVEEVIPTYDVDLEKYIKTLEDLAKNYIKIFFENKKFHCGGLIPQNLLFSKSSINIVLSTSFADGVDEIYSIMPRIPRPKEYNSKLPWIIYRFLKTLRKTTECGIPKYFQAGIILLYYKYCHGCKISEKSLNITHIIE